MYNKGDIKRYVLKKDCPKIGKEVGDYYNGEFAESIEELLANGTIIEDIMICGEKGCDNQVKEGCDFCRFHCENLPF